MSVPAETIAAVATAQGRGGVGIVRISGPLARVAAKAFSERELKPRYAHYGPFYGDNREVLDEGIALYFPGPNSFTGEDVLELQGHGGPIVLDMLLQRCIQLGCRLARPGEFSERAFLNDKLDLAQAEAVADLIDASTGVAARSAVRSLQGDFSREIGGLQAELTELRALVEATLDFPEEEVDFLEAANAFGRLDRLDARLGEVFARARQGRLLQGGLHVVLVGQPNVGKSSLLNRLAGEERAIVTDIAGTTRDALRETIQIEGIPLHITDTAGLRETTDEVEKIGIARTWQEIARADVIVRLVDVRDGLTDADAAIDARLPAGVERITVFNKVDLQARQPERVEADGGVGIYLSAKAGQGVELLRAELLRVAGWHRHGEDVILARERHLIALREAHARVNAALEARHALELMAEELRLAQEAVNQITGEFTPDDLLGVIFSRFCIGK